MGNLLKKKILNHIEARKLYCSTELEPKLGSKTIHQDELNHWTPT